MKVTNNREEIEKKLVTDITFNCRIGAMALHELKTALGGFEFILNKFGSTKRNMNAMIFRSSIISYCKPFSPFSLPNEKNRKKYEIDRIKDTELYSRKLHKHLFDIRNQMIAHTDWTEIPPDLLSISFKPDNLDWEIPVEIIIASQVLAFPKEEEFIRSIINHTNELIRLIGEELHIDLVKMRRTYVDNPELFKSTGEIRGKINPRVRDNMVEIPKNLSDRLEISQPDYSSLHLGYHYEVQQINFKYIEEEVFELGNGETVTVSPANFAAATS